MERDTVQIVTALSGHKWPQMGDGRLLCQTVDACRRHEPNLPRLSVLLEELQEETGRSAGAIYKALERARTDIWVYGNREELERIFGKPLHKRPTVKELVFALSFYLWTDG